MIIGATDIRKGMVLKLKDGLYRVQSVSHIAPGNWRAMVQLKLKNLKSGDSMEQRLSSSDKVEIPYIEQTEMEYLYSDGNKLVFMNQKNFEQVEIDKEVAQEGIAYLKENTIVKINYSDGEVIGMEIPDTVFLKVIETAPPLQGATVTNVFKPAKLETGAVVNVPSFVEVGNIVKVDTRDGKYLERVSK
jgi:elongation factor P